MRRVSTSMNRPRKKRSTNPIEGLIPPPFGTAAGIWQIEEGGRSSQNSAYARMLHHPYFRYLCVSRSLGRGSAVVLYEQWECCRRPRPRSLQRCKAGEALSMNDEREKIIWMSREPCVHPYRHDKLLSHPSMRGTPAIDGISSGYFLAR